MEPREPRLFAEYEPGGRRAEPLDANSGLSVREAGPDDAVALGRLSAERDGGDPAVCADRFTRALLATDARRDWIWVAELWGEPIAFGKVHDFAPPAGAPPDAAPEGCYLAGVVVAPAFRRRGVGRLLTSERLRWIAGRAPRAFYFASAMNRASIDLHAAFGFSEVTRTFWYPGATFTGGVGILFRRDMGTSERPI